MKFLKIQPTEYYNAAFVNKIKETPYIKKEIFVYIMNTSIHLRMSAEDFIRELESDKTIIDLTAYYMS